MGLIGPARAVRGVLCGRTARARPGHRGVRLGRLACPGTHTGPNRGVLYRRQAPGRPPEAQKKRGGLRLPRCLVAPASASVFQSGAECVQDLVNLLDILGDLIHLSKFETLDQSAPIIGKIYRGLPFL